MDDMAELLRHLFGSVNSFSLPISGTGSAGMESGIANLLEPEDVILVASCGYFGDRMAEMAKRYGAEVIKISAEWGKAIDPSLVEAELRANPKIKVLGVVHGETSTGVQQPLEELSQLAKQYESLFLVDTVTTLGANPILADSIGIDFAFSATQKCVGAPPGLAPVNLSEAALQTIAKRKTPPSTWYLDLGLLQGYWQGRTRVYHHTAPTTMIYALWEALRMITEEGLERRYARHKINGQALRSGLIALGLHLLVPSEICLYQLTAVMVPDVVDDSEFRTRLREEYNIEIGGGLNQLQGKIWRIGTMGESSSISNVLLLLSSLEDLLPKLGFNIDKGSGVAAASQVFNRANQS
jgi:alanine-glyoxylate transaminase/serine-glyoxylate transaminase/serine-pyruvate transaminase